MAHSSGIQATASALDSLLSQSSQGMHTSSDSATKCCCGRPQCAYLQHNDIALRGLEQDLHSAAQIGQALLVRHEAYMAEAEEQRRKMDATVDRLEEEKKALEAKNARTIQENRYLLDQLEDLNNSVSDADAQIVSLNTTLQSTMKELDRLTTLAAQTSHLEKQLANLESEQQLLHEQVESKEASEKSAIQRWKHAERTVNALQEQVERIEKETQEERARHAEVVGRFERRRSVEKELENAAGRLKEAAAAKGMPTEDERSSVVSNFVKDILQDNANLQMGIVELRDMLMGSNEEVENLRVQMVLHQPIHPEVHRSSEVDAQRSKSLEKELARTPIAEPVPDFHVHHHYHAASKDETKRPLMNRRPRKKRTITSPGLRTPISGSQTPQTPQTPTSNLIRPTVMTSAATILSQTSVTIHPPPRLSHTHNWSMSQAPSSAAVSSVPSSPLFDAMSDVPDCSRPTTPGSTYLGSPRFPPRHLKRESDISECNLLPGQNPSYSISSVLHAGLHDDYDSPQFQDHPSIPEELEDDTLSLDPPPQNDHSDYNPTLLIRPRLHRASSHESLLSARGLDIPKIRSHPSSASTRLLSGTLPSLVGTSGAPTATATVATAHRSKAPRKGTFDSKRSYSSLLSASNNMSTSPPSAAEKSTIGQRVGVLGGWIAGRWGIAPVATSGAGVASPTDSTFSKTSAESTHAGKRPSVSVQQGSAAAALSQKLSLNGERSDAHGRKEDRISTHIEPVHLNDSLLQESLSEERVPTVNTTRKEESSVRTLSHHEPLNVNNSLLQETLSEERAATEQTVPVPTVARAEVVPAVNKRRDEMGVHASRGRGRENRLSTHVEAEGVDGEALGEALGGL